MVAELKLGMSKSVGFSTFSISALPSEVPFQIHGYNLWPLSQNMYIQIFEKCCTVIRQNVPGV